MWTWRPSPDSRDAMRRNAGMTLLETLAYCVGLAVVVNICAMLFAQTSRLSLIGANAVDRMDVIDTIRRDFDDTVHSASDVVDEVQGFLSDNHAVVLRLAPDPSDASRYAVYAVLGDTNRLCRRVISVRNGRMTLERATSYPIDVRSLDVTYDTARPAQARTVSLRIQLELGHKDNRLGTTATFAASLRTHRAEGILP